MNWDVIEGRWHELKGKLKSKWAKLTDQNAGALGAKGTELRGRLQRRYGHKKDDTEQHLDEWMKAVSDRRPDSDQSSQTKH